MKIIVLKIGGKELDNDDELDIFASCVKEISGQGMHCILVHGGGKQIDRRLKEKNIQPKYLDGVRVTDEETMKVVEEVLCVEIEDRLNRFYRENPETRQRHMLFTLNFPDSTYPRAVIAKKTSNKSLGLVGEITHIDVNLLKTLLKAGWVSFFAPIAKDEVTGGSLNVNADVFASKLASALNAEVLALITDVPGIYDEKQNVISSLTVKEAKKLMKSPVIQSGMIPKLSSCAAAVEGGVKRAYILDSKTLSAKLSEVLSGKPCSTMIYSGK